MTSPVLLGPAMKYSGATTAEVGKWLVVFEHNKAKWLYPAGVVISKLRGRVPFFGGSVATLDTTPHPVWISLPKVYTKDRYFLPEVVVRLLIRLNPEATGAESQLIDLINKDASRLFGSIEACIRDEVSAQVRRAIATVDAIDIVKHGAKEIIFPGSKVKLSSVPCVEMRALEGVDSQESSLAAQVRETAEQAVSVEQSADDRRILREQAAKDAAHQADLDYRIEFAKRRNESLLEEARLAELTKRADLLGIDLLALAEPAVFAQITGQRHELLRTLLEQQHLARHMRTNPELAQAVLRQLGGGTTPVGQPSASPLMTRRAEMVIDAANPNEMRQLTTGTGVLSTSKSVAELQQIALGIDPYIMKAWSSSGGTPGLSGAALSVTLDRMRAFVILMASSRPIVPQTFKSELIGTLGIAGNDLTEVEGVIVTGSTLDAAIHKLVEVITDETAVIPIIQMRHAAGQREVLIELSGDAGAAKKGYERLTDPDYPGLQALENLANKQLRIRVIPPVTT